MSGGRVLVVDDDPGCRDLYSVWLSEDYAVETVGTGQAGVEHVEWPDIVVLDRQLPGIDGTTVAEHIEDAPPSPYVVMVSGVEPDVDIVDLPVDAYLTKPVAGEELRDTVDTMIARGDCEDALRELFALRARKQVLKRRRRPSELADDDRYQELLRTLERRRATVREQIDQFDESRREEIHEVLTEAGNGAESPS